jgi:hypothetical protein
MDTCTARQGVIRGFQNEEHRALAKYQSVAVAGKWPAAASDLIRIGPGQRAQAVPGPHDRRDQRSLTAAGNRDVEVSMANPAHGIAERHAGRRARGGMGDDRAGNLVVNRNPSGRRIGHSGHEGEGAGGLLAIGMVIVQPLAYGIDAAVNGSRKNPHAKVKVGAIRRQPGVGQRLIGGGYADF